MTDRSDSGRDDPFGSTLQPFVELPIRVPQGPDTVINPEQRPMSSDNDSLSASSRSTSDEQSREAEELLEILFPAGNSEPAVSEMSLAHFKIIERVGTGGMGAVFRARDARLQRIVALKILAPGHAGESQAVRRFRNEARAAAMLFHENIAGVYFTGEHRGIHFIAYEYVDGVNLRDLIRQRRRLNISEAVNYTLQVAAALSHMASLGVTHRDIKPSNIIVTSGGRAKLVDLGLARTQNEDTVGELTVAGTTLGTFDYIAPEQAKDPRLVDVRSDIYALGCTLYHMVAGSPPYADGTMLQKLLDHQGKEPPDPRAKNQRVPESLSIIIRRMMASDPKRRYATPELLVRDLLLVAGSLGMRGQTAEGLIWTASANSSRRFWSRHLGWMSTAAALLLIVLIIQRFPELSNTAVKPRNGSTTTGSRPSGLMDQTAPRSRQGIGTTPNVGVSDPAMLPQDTGEPVGILAEKIDVGGDEAGESGLNGDTIAETASSSSSTGYSGDDASGPPYRRDVWVLGTAGAASFNGQTAVRPDLGAVSGPLVKQPAIVMYSPDGNEERAFATLEAACAAATDGAIVELRYNGRHPSGRTERPLQIVDKTVTIRARDGFRPRIEFNATGAIDASDSRMITLHGGSIELVNVDLALRVDESSPSDVWALFSLRNARQVLLNGTTIHLINPGGRRAAIVEFGEEFESAVSMDIDGNPSPPLPLEFRMTDSVVVADADFFLVAGPEPARLEISQCALLLNGVVLQATSGNDMPTDDQSLRLAMQSNTCLGLGLVRFDCNQVSPNILPLEVIAEQNLLSLLDPSGSLVTINGEGSVDELRQLLSRWYGRNNRFDGLDAFWVVQVDQGSTSLLRANFEDWKAHWTVTGDSSELSSSNATLAWEGSGEETLFQQIDSSWLTSVNDAIDAESVDETSETSRIGAALSRLPALPIPGRNEDSGVSPTTD